MTHDAPPARGNLGLGIAMGALVGAVLIMIAWFALDSPDAATPAPSPTPTATASTPSPSRTPSASATPSATPTPTPSATDTPTAAPTESAPPAPPGIVTSLPPGWVTVLESLPKASTSPEQAVAKAAEWSQHGYTASVLDTDAFAGLTPGYYAIAITGQTGREDFRAVCAAYGQPATKCYPREIKG